MLLEKKILALEYFSTQNRCLRQRTPVLLKKLCSFSQEVLTGVSLFRDSPRRVVVPEEKLSFRSRLVVRGIYPSYRKYFFLERGRNSLKENYVSLKGMFFFSEHV